MHEDHRQRLRALFRSAGLDSLQPHNVLELLLFYSIPRRDTNEIAHRLLDHFGTLVNVLDAAPEELCRVEGVGEASATLISFAAQLARRYCAEQSGEKISFRSAKEFQQFVLSQFLGEKNEVTYLFCLDNAGQLLRQCKVSLGTKYSVSLDNRTLLETAFHHNATRVVLAHNHPNGLCAPSQEDIRLTESVVKLYSEVNIRLLDHLIIAGGECFSMAAHPKLRRLFISKVIAMEEQRAADVT